MRDAGARHSRRGYRRHRARDRQPGTGAGEGRLPNDIGELVGRAQADYPQYEFAPPETEKARLAGEGSVLASFEGGVDFGRIVAEKVVFENASKRRLTVENELARTHGVTNGQDAALDLIVEPADGKAVLVQMDCLSAF